MVGMDTLNLTPEVKDAIFNGYRRLKDSRKVVNMWEWVRDTENDCVVIRNKTDRNILVAMVSASLVSPHQDSAVVYATLVELINGRNACPTT